MLLSDSRAEELRETCRRYRVEMLKAIYGAQSGHCGGSFSVCEILTLLYHEFLRLDAARPDDPDRDRLVLSKGHAVPAAYVNLIDKGFLPKGSMSTLRRLNSQLQGHACIHTPGIEMSAGPLGLGLGAAQGMALGLRLRGSPAHVWAVLGDGELDEGVVWESAMSISKFRLDNLTAVVDNNQIQLDGSTQEIMPLGNLVAKWEAFGWNVLECDGNNLQALAAAFDAALSHKGQPTLLLAHTVKGKGVSFMEGTSKWHGQVVDDESYRLAMAELGGTQ